MSTVDPGEARRARKRRAAERNRRGAPLGVFFWCLLLAYGGLWGLAAYGAADAAAFPLASGYLTEDLFPVNDTPGYLWALFTGTTAALFLGLAVGARCTTRLGPYVGPALLRALACTGAGLGLLLGARDLWTRPPRTGAFVDAAGRAGAEWGIGPWAAWTSQWWVPGLLLLMAVRGVVAAVVRDRVRRRRDARTRDLLRTGRRVPGEVTAVSATGVEIDGRPRLEFDVRFTDHQGVRRWVTRRGCFDKAALPRVGDPAAVWFDPADPGDQKSIPVALTGLHDDAEEMLGRDELPFV
ncbi:DUF3592 domain-containing protein [Streptomyces uncialis]|uniref:DUF3592 domain-containing protein n=1 Tax=Streptomyces uncialis TaxID=1048205 RepID=UPI00116104FE|nr:DUF3592 domain-containing protein [Streptomyces uncialis]